MGLVLSGLSINTFAQDSRSLREMMITPGKLQSAHRELETDCNACHVEFTRDQQDQLCLDCHQVITADIQFNQGFHGGLEAPACLDCHTEHLGEDAKITVFDPELFDHKNTDFELKGEHQQLACNDCHNDEMRKKNKLAGEFRIEAQQCIDCHESPHGSTPSYQTTDGVNNVSSVFSDTCTECHSEAGWKTTTFDHGETGFRLENRHGELHCAACHSDSTYTAPTKCQDCHQLQDPHWGYVGEQCADCHQTATWEEVTFNHDETRFPLQGEHQGLVCQQCHARPAEKLNEQFNDDEASKTLCHSCHMSDDIHEGSYGTDCQMCHTEKQWDSASFNHDKNTDFTLTGPHREASCLACHAPGQSSPPGNQCIDCHSSSDVHQGALGSTCDDCHTGLENWQQPLFDHDFTDFPLIGLHKILGCQSCHATDQTFQLPLNSCEDCHLNATSHNHAFNNTCENCHSTRGWDQHKFDHQKNTDFPLRGAHREVNCLTCHHEDLATPDTPDQQCYSCHKKDDVHDQRFGSQCGNCHNESNFSDVLTNRR